ncbi:SRPBCC family protein [Actinomarinicola tropica]|uniref:Activator of Hsp90 ATPase homologue 1/2-like C-terminal domain-containing protein n=1 Tax=Actinomarinicola tropica TaxID=2789776 RepID=A0A5Q2RFL3_9ACTN|nr:SRPBCC domain-containing protein [Actinomarinicola tropica]QGG94434.1 hypothetical protein GH723_04555 [Actinomarinicola tropica]
MATLDPELTAHTPAGRADSFDASRGYVIQRTFDAPQALVWRALSEADLFARWFGADVPMEVHEWDLRDGGTWRGTMTYEGNEIHWVGEFVVVEPPDRLVIAISDEGEVRDTDDLMQMSLREVDGRTEVTVVQNGGGLTDEQYEMAKEGSQSFLEAIDKVLADLA